MPPGSPPAPPYASFLVGGGESGAVIRALSWEESLLGPVREWPQSLRTSLGICLSSRFPIALYWGSQFVMLYNDALLPMVGANKHPGAMGRPAFEVLPEIRDVIEPMLKRVIETGEAIWSEDLMLPLRRKDAQEESYFTFTYSPIRVESGDVGGVFCAVLETTERVIEGRRLRLLNALAKAAPGETPQEACVRAVALIQSDPSDVPFALLYLLDEHSRTATLAGTANIEPGAPRAPRTIPFGDSSSWAFPEEDAEGAHRFVDLDAGPGGARGAAILPIERAGGGTPLGFIVAGLSPLLMRSDSYDRFHNLLSASISQSVSNAAAYEQERKRAEALAELDRAKTTFFSNVSHEFRTPLTLMLAPIQQMASTPAGTPIDHAAVDLLQRNALRLLKLVNTLLEFSRIEAGRVEAVYEPVDLSEVTSELAGMFRTAIESAGLALVVECPPLPEPLYVDRDMWEKIVLNLLSNAFKYTFAGSVTVRLRMADEDVILEVADTGTGIADGELPRMFERFHRIEGARARSHEGSGIGLALIQGLVRLHGGEVSVTSRVGVGSLFQVRLPRGQVHLPAARIKAKRVLPSTAVRAGAYVDEALRWGVQASDGPVARTPTRPSLPASSSRSRTRARILYADDSSDMRDYVSRLLSERWDVETTGDGTSALASIRRDAPDLLLCDVMMPGLDGFALTEAIRADPVLRALPVLLLSARAGEEESSRGLNAGANDYIAKPFSARDLLVRIGSALAVGRVSNEVRAVQEAQRAYLARLFEHAPVGIAVLRGPEHIFDVANPQYARLVAGHELLQRPIREALPELAGQGIYETLDRVYETGEPFLGRSVRLMLVNADGLTEERFFDFSYQPVPDAAGKIESILVVVFEITELATARRDADAANRAKDEFFAILGHELRNPLAPIITALDLIRMRGDVTLPKEIAIVERQVAQIARLVEDLLDVSRITGGKVVLRRTLVELSEVVSKAIEAAAPLFDTRRHRIEVVVPEKGLVVDGDVMRLVQVVTNLMINAAKYTEPGGHVRVSAAASAGYVELSIADSGIGISKEMLPRVFEPFAQSSQALDRAQGGLGLGLTIVSNLVKLHGGTIQARSEGPGRGSTFTISLPLSTGAMPTGASGHRQRQRQSWARRAGSVRVLIVDDNVDAAEMLAEVLEAIGCDTRIAFDGLEGLNAFEQFEPQVALLDIGLPVMDGYELARRLRSGQGARPLCLVAVTGYGRDSDRDRVAQSGFDAHLVKPVSVELVGELIDHFRTAGSLDGFGAGREK